MPKTNIRFPSYQLPPVSLSTSSSKLEGWESLNAAYAQNLFELEQANPYVRMLAAGQNLSTNAAFEGIVWGSESGLSPRQGMLPLSTGTTYLEIPVDGIWTIDAQISVNTTATRFQAVIEKVAGTGQLGTLRSDRILGPVEVRQCISVTMPFYKGDRLALQGQNSGTEPLGVNTGDSETWMSLTGLGVKAP